MDATEAHRQLAVMVGEYVYHFEEHRTLWMAPDARTPARDAVHKLRLPDGNSAVEAAVEWWAYSGSTLQGRERVEHLHHLLRRLDKLLSHHHPMVVRTEAGALVIGARWWDRYRKSRGGGGRGAFVPSVPPLPHLRLVRPEALRAWIHDEEHDDRISQFVWSSTRDDGTVEEASLVVGLCVLGDRAHTRFSLTERLDDSANIYGFRATHVEWTGGTGSIAEELVDAMNWARAEEVHVLCFPELSISPDDRWVLAEELRRDPGKLCMVFPGSFHEECKGAAGRANRAPVWLVRNVGEGAEWVDAGYFDKFIPFTLPRDPVIEGTPEDCAELREHIDCGESPTFIETPFGQFGLCVCKDLFDDALIRRYAPALDHMLVLSMQSSPTEWFSVHADKLSKYADASCFYVNSSQFVEAGDAATELVFVHFPGGTGQSRAYFRNDPGEGRRTAGHAIPPDLRLKFEIKIPTELEPRR